MKIKRCLEIYFVVLELLLCLCEGFFCVLWFYLVISGKSGNFVILFVLFCLFIVGIWKFMGFWVKGWDLLLVIWGCEEGSIVGLCEDSILII